MKITLYWLAIVALASLAGCKTEEPLTTTTTTSETTVRQPAATTETQTVRTY